MSVAKSVVFIREVVRLPEKARVVVVDDQYVPRSLFEIQVQMSKGYELAASPFPARSRPSPFAWNTKWTWSSWT